MITFLISLVVLIVGFALYSKLIEKVFRVDDRQTPAVAHPDGVDYTPMKTWRLFLNQLLNIAGRLPFFEERPGRCLLGSPCVPVERLWYHPGRRRA